jgi:hypothetical protein
MDSIASNSVCFDDSEHVSFCSGTAPGDRERRPSGVQTVFIPDAHKFRRPSEARASSYFSLAGDVLFECERDQRAVLSILENFSMQEEPTNFDARIDDILVSILPQKAQLAQRADVRNFISNEIFKVIGVHAIDIGHYRLRCFLPDESIELGITVGEDSKQDWCEKLVKHLGCLMGFEATDTAVADDSSSSGAALFLVSTLVVVPPTDSTSEHWKIQCSVGSITVDITTVSKTDLCIVAFFEEVDQLAGRDHLFKRSVILVKAWWIYEFPAVAQNSVEAWTPQVWLLCSLLCFVFNKHHKKIFHPVHALIYFFIECAYFDWKNMALTIFGGLEKTECANAPKRLELESTGIDVPLVTNAVLNKYRELAKNFSALETGVASGSSDSDKDKDKDKKAKTEVVWSDVGGIVMEHALLSGVNVCSSSAGDPDSGVFIMALRSGIVLLSDMVSSKQDDAQAQQEAVENFFGGTISRFGSRNGKGSPSRQTQAQGQDDNQPSSASVSVPTSVSVSASARAGAGLRGSIGSDSRADGLSSWWNFGGSSMGGKDDDSSHIISALRYVFALLYIYLLLSVC